MKKWLIAIVGLLLCTPNVWANPPVIWYGNSAKLLPTGGFTMGGSDLKRILDLNVNPTAGAGVAAPIGSMAIVNNGGVGEIYVKFGALDTDWLPAAGGLSASLASGKIYLGDAANVAQPVSLSGDGTLSNTGVLTLSAGAVDLTTDVTGVLPVANGGTGSALATLAAEDVILGASSTAFKRLGVGSNGQVLTITGGAVAWSTGTLSGTNTGDVTLGAVGSTPNNNGATLTNQVLNLEPADATHPGVVTTGAQTLAGDKTLSGTLNLSALTASLPLKLDASKNVTSAAIGLGSSEVTGTLAVGNGGTGSTAFAAGSIPFSNGTLLTQDNANLFWDDTNNFLGIGTATPTDPLDVRGGASFTLSTDNNLYVDGATNPRQITLGVMRFEHQPAIDGTRAIHINVQPTNFSDTRGMVVKQTMAGITQPVHNQSLNLDADITGTQNLHLDYLRISKAGDKHATTQLHGVVINEDIDPIYHHSGTMQAVDTAFTDNGAFTDVTANLGNAGSNSTLFAANNEYLYLGHSAQFREISVILATAASNPGIKPTFQYSQGGAAWATLPVADNTNGFRESGSIGFAVPADWATDTVNAVGSRYWVRIRRTQASLSTAPIESQIRVLAYTSYHWNASGDLMVNSAKGGNLKLSVNILSSENTNGNVDLEPNGTGAVILGNHTDIEKVAAPAAPAATHVRVYAKADNKLYVKDSGGTEKLLGSSTVAYGSRGTPRDIVAGTGITSGASHMSTTETDQVVFIQGSGGAVTISASPAIEAHTVVGARMTVIGRSNTNTVAIPNQAALVELNGDAILGASDVLNLIWDGTAWVETGRNF